jgi:5-methyltetrahydropteroyltriglutamate--homocysteine methyltransferase
MDLQATTLGVFPLPDGARERLADLKGHQKGDLLTGEDPPVLDAAYDDARERVIADQHDANIDLIVEGQLRWDDMLAHPLTMAEGVDPGGIVRYYDNNNFYRDPVITGALGSSGDVARDLEVAREVTSNLQAVLPGPWTLTDLATDHYYGDDGALVAAIADLLADEVRAFPEHDRLVLPSPSLVTNPPENEHGNAVREAIDTVATASDAEVLVVPFYGVPDEATYAHLLDADVGIGYDLVSDHHGAVELVGEYGTTETVLLGVVDGQHSGVEDVETVRERAAWFRDQIPDVNEPEEALLAPNTELFYLPVERYRAKLATLGQATTRSEVKA